LQAQEVLTVVKSQNVLAVAKAQGTNCPEDLLGGQLGLHSLFFINTLLYCEFKWFPISG